MNPNELIRTIEDQHKLLYVPEISKVETHSLVRHGYFVDFEDASELKEQGKFRFITNTNWKTYNDELNKARQTNPNAKGNPRHSVIIDVKDIINLSVVRYN